MNRNYITAIIALFVLAVFAYLFYQYTVRENEPGENRYRLANKHLEDGKNEEALALFDELIADYPGYKEAHLGRAITLMQLSSFSESKDSFDRALSIDPGFATAYANRAILLDRMGRYEEAVRDYRKAIEIRPKLAKGPGWLWRFLHNVHERPPTIADRADYIEAELKKPEDERLLRVPEIDEQQRMYKK